MNNLTNQRKGQLGKFLTIFLAIGILCTFQVSGQSLSIQGPADSIKAGDAFTFSITIESPITYERVLFPDSSAFTGDIEFLSRRQYKVSDFSDSTVYHLQNFSIEDINIPPLPVYILTESDTTLLFTDPFSLNFSSVLQSEEDPLKPLKPNFSFDRLLWPWLLGFLAALLIGYFIYQKYFKKEEQPTIHKKVVPVFSNPITILENQLIGIKERHTQNVNKDYKWFYSEIGDALRAYIEELYKIPALESTTRELLRYMDAFGMDAELIKYIRSVLNEADMIKFAKVIPTLDQSMNAYHQAHSFLDRAKIVDVQRIDRMKQDFKEQFIEEESENGMG